MFLVALFTLAGVLVWLSARLDPDGELGFLCRRTENGSVASVRVPAADSGMCVSSRVFRASSGETTGSGTGSNVWVCPFEDPEIRVDRDPDLGTPAFVRSTARFLTESPADMKAEEIVHAYVAANSRDYCLAVSDLAPLNAYLSRDFTTARNGMRSLTYQQMHNGIDIYGATFAVNLTRHGEIINVASRALHMPSVRVRECDRRLSAPDAVAKAAQSLGAALSRKPDLLSEQEGLNEMQELGGSPELNDSACAKLVYFPVDLTSLVLAWDVVLSVRGNPETHHMILDADSGEQLFDQSLTWGMESASYKVFTSDSPSPFSPGQDAPTNDLPPTVPRTLVSLTAFETNASPGGWIPDGANETQGNNVDAYADRNDDNLPDDARPQGNPYRVFDFSLDLASEPADYLAASIAQAFYAGNVFHDRLYLLGFDEAAGNFQQDNYGRGGTGYDPVRIEIQDGASLRDGSHVNNANFTVFSDGHPGRLQAFVWNRSTPDRDAALDTEVIYHELAHGVSSRLIGDGFGLSGTQSRGLAEGWSDFIAMSLLSQEGDNTCGCYPFGGYVAARNGYANNYYYGIRRFPYSTDTDKAPQTFADTDVTQIDFDPAIPVNPHVSSAADEYHRVGEIWCLALWECRAHLLDWYGFAGNELMLQLLVDGMKLTPSAPTFIQARDAILQADLVNNGGIHRLALWRGFAKRGLGFSATAPVSSTTLGVQEAFDLPVSVNVMATEKVGSDGDGSVEPGESAELVVTVGSVEQELSGIHATLTAVSSNILVTQPTASFPDIASGASSTSSVPFEFSVAPPFPGFTDAWFDLLFSTDQGPFIQRVHVRIGNPQDYPPEITGVAVSSISETNALIRWSTEMPSDSQVEYGTSASYGWTTTVDPAPATHHAVALAGLVRGTLYHFRVKSRGANALLGVSGDGQFVTQARIFVDANRTNPVELGTVDAPFRTIPAAVASASAGDELLVAEGIYTNGTAEAILDLDGVGHHLKVYGGYNSDFSMRDSTLYRTVFDGDDTRRGVRLDNGAVLEMDGVCITNGNHEWGGGLLVRKSSLVANNCAFVNNRAITGNHVGGAMEATLGSQVVLKNCIIRQNQAMVGGGIYIAASGTRVEMTRCVVSGNTGSIVGGGVYMDTGGSASLAGCVINDNIAGYGAGGVGVAPFCSADLVHCTITRNGVTNDVHNVWDGGGGVAISGPLSTAIAHIDNCIIYGNSSNNGDDLHCSAQSEVYCNYSNIGDIYDFMTAHAGLINADPLFFDPPSGDFHLRTGSPCIDTGMLIDQVMGDIDDESRPFGATMDMGADEYVDSDVDGLPDYWEKAYWGGITNNDNRSDMDSDDLSDQEEYGNRTNPSSPDTDVDGMPDGWEVAYSLNPLANDALGDADSDKMSNIDEYYSGTIPTSAASFLGISALVRQGDDRLVTWRTVYGKGYRVQRTEDLASGVWSNLFSAAIPESNEFPEGTESLLDRTGPRNRPAFYRILLDP